MRGSNGSQGSVKAPPPPPEASSPTGPPPPPGESQAAAWRDDGDSRLTVSSAVRNHRIVFLLPIVFLVSAAVVAGLLREPTYTAETRLAVGGLDASSPASNSDFAAAAATLAQTYGRSVQGDLVVDAVARKTHSSPATVRAHIAAFTIPSTPLFSVEGVASSPGAAIDLANLTSEALQEAANEATQDLVPPLLAHYREAATAQQRVERNVRFLESTSAGTELVKARAQLAISKTRAASAREAFVEGQQRQQSLAVPIQVIERANSAGSDRYSVLELWIFIALVLGLIVGTALALFRESRFLYAT
jgi:capsular polysaccharide biosynthesis protein